MCEIEVCEGALTHEHLGTRGLLLDMLVTTSNSLDPRPWFPHLKIRFLPAQRACISVASEGWESGKDVGGAYERLVFPFLDFPPPPLRSLRRVFHPDDTGAHAELRVGGAQSEPIT